MSELIWSAFALIFLTGIGLGAVLMEVVKPWLKQVWRKRGYWDNYRARWHG